MYLINAQSMGNIRLMLDCAFCMISSLQIDPQNVIGRCSLSCDLHPPEKSTYYEALNL